MHNCAAPVSAETRMRVWTPGRHCSHSCPVCSTMRMMSPYRTDEPGPSPPIAGGPLWTLRWPAPRSDLRHLSLAFRLHHREACGDVVPAGDVLAGRPPVG